MSQYAGVNARDPRSTKSRQEQTSDDDMGFETVDFNQCDSPENVRRLFTHIDAAFKILPAALKEFEALENFRQLRGSNRYKEDHDKMKQKVGEMKKENDDLKGEIRRLKKLVGDLEGERKAGTELQKQQEDLQRQLLTTKAELKQVKAELEETKTRLSKAMGTKLTDGNANIADLSDKYRPTKIAERYQELYDNQWTDAYEKTIEGTFGNETEAVKTLIEILKDIMKTCQEVADKQITLMKNALMITPSKELPSDIYKQLKDYRKMLSQQSGVAVYEDYMKKLKESYRTKDKMASRIPEFVKECLNICWLMVVQDPPVEFGPDVDKGDRLDHDMFKEYTTTGDTVDFMVWPAMLLHQGGPVLCKGVAQGTGERRRPKLAPPDRRERELKQETTTYAESYGNGSKLADDHRSYDFDHKYTSSFKPRYEQTTVLPRSTYSSDRNRDRDYYQRDSPSRYDIDQYFRYIESHGPTYARNLMGDSLYSQCRNYVSSNYGGY